MNTIKHLRVVDVDHDGYNGREHHPTDADKGTIVRVQRMEIDEWESPDPELGDLSYGVWICLRPDGSTVELIDHEVEPA